MIGVSPHPTVPLAPAATSALLEVQQLRAEISTEQGTLVAIKDVSFSIGRGKTLAIVGETGSGKSMTALALLRLLPQPSRIAGGRIVLRSQKLGQVDLASLRDNSEVLYRIRGGVISLIFQEPLSALSPVHTIGSQIVEMVRLHSDASAPEAKVRSLEMLAKVGIPNPERSFEQYPHQLSGGMRQRAVIAMALVCRPELVIADEPTTALDMTTQAQVLNLLKTLQREIGCSLLLITHDMAVVAQMADEVAVMYYGQIVEQGPMRSVMTKPIHPYTRGLIQSLPAMNTGKRLFTIPGSAPSLLAAPAGCPFHPRCAYAQANRCDVGEVPPLRPFRSGQLGACVRLEEINP